MKSKRKSSRNRLGVESLENRAMMAVVVPAAPVKGTLTVTGDGTTELISITQTSANSITITGLSNTVVNGVANGTATVANVKSLNIDLGLGGDTATVGSAIVLKKNFAILGGDIGDGINTYNVDNLTAKRLDITGGDAGDIINVGTASAVTLSRMVIDGGDGGDTIGVNRLTVNKAVIRGGNGIDAINVGTIAGTIVTANKLIGIDGGSGIDTPINITRLSAKKLVVNNPLTGGTDTVTYDTVPTVTPIKTKSDRVVDGVIGTDFAVKRRITPATQAIADAGTLFNKLTKDV